MTIAETEIEAALGVIKHLEDNDGYDLHDVEQHLVHALAALNVMTGNERPRASWEWSPDAHREWLPEEKPETLIPDEEFRWTGDDVHRLIAQKNALREALERSKKLTTGGTYPTEVAAGKAARQRLTEIAELIDEALGDSG